MGNHGWVARTPDPAHGHLSGCDDRGDAAAECCFAADEALRVSPAQNPSLRAEPEGLPLDQGERRESVPLPLRRGRLLSAFHEDGHAHVDVFIPQCRIA